MIQNLTSLNIMETEIGILSGSFSKMPQRRSREKLPTNFAKTLKLLISTRDFHKINFYYFIMILKGTMPHTRNFSITPSYYKSCLSYTK